MGYIKFLKPGEVSKKNQKYTSSIKLMKRYKILSIIEGLLILGYILTTIIQRY